MTRKVYDNSLRTYVHDSKGRTDVLNSLDGKLNWREKDLLILRHKDNNGVPQRYSVLGHIEDSIKKGKKTTYTYIPIKQNHKSKCKGFLRAFHSYTLDKLHFDQPTIN